MDIDHRLHLLNELCRLHAHFIGRFDLACAKGCALCCTTNVTITTMEGLRIVRYWVENQLPLPLPELTAASRQPRFQPVTTINQLAACCLQGEQPPEDEADPNVGPCPLLREEQCTIYEVRPFGCRAMVSRAHCVDENAARMPDPVLSANNLVLQYIEAIDIPGVTGNMVDLLLLFNDAAFRNAYEKGRGVAPAQKMADNISIPAVMIDPAHRRYLEPLLMEIRKLFKSPFCRGPNAP